MWNSSNETPRFMISFMAIILFFPQGLKSVYTGRVSATFFQTSVSHVADGSDDISFESILLSTTALAHWSCVGLSTLPKHGEPTAELWLNASFVSTDAGLKLLRCCFHYEASVDEELELQVWSAKEKLFLLLQLFLLFIFFMLLNEKNLTDLFGSFWPWE